jgi:hypothetical protein
MEVGVIDGARGMTARVSHTMLEPVDGLAVQVVQAAAQFGFDRDVFEHQSAVEAGETLDVCRRA